MMRGLGVFAAIFVAFGILIGCQAPGEPTPASDGPGFGPVTLGDTRAEVLQAVARRYRLSPVCEETGAGASLCRLSAVGAKPALLTFQSMPVEAIDYHFRQARLAAIAVRLLPADPDSARERIARRFASARRVPGETDRWLADGHPVRLDSLEDGRLRLVIGATGD